MTLLLLIGFLAKNLEDPTTGPQQDHKETGENKVEEKVCIWHFLYHEGKNLPDQTNCMLTLVVVYFASKVNEKSFLLVCYFTLDNIYEVRILFIVVLDRTTGQCPLSVLPGYQDLHNFF